MQIVMNLTFAAGLPCASIDRNIADFFREHLTPLFANILLTMSEPGSAICVGSIIGIAALWLVLKRHWHGLLAIGLTVGGGSLLGETLKLVFRRQRPFLYGPIGTWGGYSFPSGHTIAATLLYGFLAMAVFTRVKRRRWQYLSLATGALLIMCVGFSRIALGAHYLTDVLAAMTLGTTWIWLCRTFTTNLRRRGELREAQEPASVAD